MYLPDCNKPSVYKKNSLLKLSDVFELKVCKLMCNNLKKFDVKHTKLTLHLLVLFIHKIL